MRNKNLWKHWKKPTFEQQIKEVQIPKEIKTVKEEFKNNIEPCIKKKKKIIKKKRKKRKKNIKKENKKMGSRSYNLWGEKNKKKEELTQISSTARVEIKLREDEKIENNEEKIENKKNIKKENIDKEIKILSMSDEQSIITKTKEKEIMVSDIPELPLEDLDVSTDETEDSSVQDESGGSVVFGIVGAGQAGGRLAESFYKLGYKKCLAVNTAEHDLDGLVAIPEIQKILMYTGSPGGAGKDMRKGEAAADKHQQEIYEKMQKIFGKVERILVCIGQGGGSGAGACLRLVETAKKYLTYLGMENVNDKVGVLATLPTAGEAASPIVAENAYLIASKLCEYAKEKEISPLIIFDNDKIKKMYPKLTVGKFWDTVNATVTGLFHMFNVLSTKVGNPTSFDPADYGRVLSAGGCMIMGLTNVKQYKDGTDISRAIRENLEKTLLCGGFDISTAQAAACIATASERILNEVPGLMDSLETGFDTMANITGNAIVMRGIYEVEKDKLTIYTMITGLDEPTKRLKELNKFQTLSTTKSKLYD